MKDAQLSNAKMYHGIKRFEIRIPQSGLFFGLVLKITSIFH